MLKDCRWSYPDDLGNDVDDAEESGAELPIAEIDWSSDVTEVVDEIWGVVELLRSADSDKEVNDTTEEACDRSELRDIEIAAPGNKVLCDTELARAGDDATNELLAPPVDDGDKLRLFEDDSVNDSELTPAAIDQQTLRTSGKCNLRLRQPLLKAILARRGRGGGMKGERTARSRARRAL